MKVGLVFPIFLQYCTSPYNATDRRDKERHGFLRRVMRPAFNTATLDQISPTVECFVKKLVRGIEEEAMENHGVADVKNWVYNFTFAVTLFTPLLM